MRKTVFKKIAIILLVLDFLVVLYGGLIFYQNYPGLQRVEAALQNSSEVLLFNPILTVEAIQQDSERVDTFTPWERFFISSVYGVAVAVTPFIDFLFVCSLVDSLLQILSRITFKKKRRILIIGYNDHVKKLIKNNNKKKNKIYLWTEENLPLEEEKSLFLKRVKVQMNESPISEKSNGQIKKIDRFIRACRIKYVVLVDDSDSRNFQYYMTLSHCKACEKRTVHFFVLNHRFENQNALTGYFDNRLKEMLQKDTQQKDTHLDLRIFNFPQIQAEILYRELPLHKNAELNENRNLHLLVIGGGQVGEYAILHAMNQGVLTDTNEIFIDVIDKEPEALYQRLCERFNTEYVQTQGRRVFQITPDKADGRFVIRLTKADVGDPGFSDVIRKLGQDAGRNDVLSGMSCDDQIVHPACKEFTYIAVCIPDDDANLHCVLELEKILAKSGRRIPLALRLSDSNEIRNYFQSFSFVSAVYLMGTNEEEIGLDEIINQEEEKNIRRYHDTYDYLSSMDQSRENSESMKDIDAKWNGEKYYKRQSNRALYFHRKVKGEEACFQNEKVDSEMLAFWEYALKTGSDDLKAISDKLLQCYPALEQFAKAEHRRFCYYYASEGWGYDLHKDEKLKLHNCLCTWENLKNDPDTRNYLVYDLISSPYLMNEIGSDKIRTT